MKLYIITSILNIDNVLSSESISPVFFYKSRTFGYRHFELIPNLKNPLDKIPLFDYLPYAEIVDDNRINYPFVLEIDDYEQLSETKIKKWQDGVFLFDKTLYINPFNCRLLFFSREAYNEAELRCSDSKTDKLYSYYQKSVVQKKEAKDISNISLPFSEDVTVDNHIRTDERFNAQKGFLLGWYLGSGKNIDPVFAKLKSIEKRTYDYVSAIKNNNGIVTPAYRDALNELDKQYKCNDPNIRKAQDLWGKEISSFCSDQDAFNSFLKKHGVESAIKNAFSQTFNIPHRKNFPIENYESFMNEMTNYTNILQLSSQPSYSFYSETDSDDSKLFSILIKKLFLDNIFQLEDLRINRSSIAKNFITEIKQFIESNGRLWENSNEYKYLQSLMLNIVQSDAFDFSSIQNDLLKSVAAFLLKGDDYEDMMSYLQNNAMSNYCYALGLWGAACGYVDMPRSITNVLFESSDLKWDIVYKQIHKEVFGYDLLGTIDTESKSEGKSNEKIDKKVVESLSGKSVEQISSKASNQCENYSVQINAEDEKTDKFTNQIVQQIKNHPKFNEQKYTTYINQISRNSLKELDRIRALSSKSDGWKGIIDDIKKTSKKVYNSQPSMFNNQEMYPIGDYFYRDDNAWYHIEPLIGDKKAKKKIKDDLVWFQKNIFAKPKGQRGYNYDEIDEKDNKIVIEKFCNLKRGKDSKGKEKAPYFTEKLRECIKNKLMDLYNLK